MKSSLLNLILHTLSWSLNFYTIWILYGWKFNYPRPRTETIFFISMKRNTLRIESWEFLPKCFFTDETCPSFTTVFRPDFFGVVVLPVFVNFTCQFLDSCYFWSWWGRCHKMVWKLVKLQKESPAGCAGEDLSGAALLSFIRNFLWKFVPEHVLS